jgi:hypothetical protein
VNMAKKFRHLKPGDLITADFMNTILDALNSLEARLSAVEARQARRVPDSGSPRRAAKRKRTA